MVLHAHQLRISLRSDNKISSVHKAAFVKIGEMGELDILDMDPIKLIWRPDTVSKSHVWGNTTFNSKKSAKDAMSDAEKDIFE